MALLPSAQPMNAPSSQASFLPSDYIARKAAFRNNVITASLFVMVMGATVGAFVVTHIQWRGLKARYEEVTQACEGEKKKLAQLDTLRQQRSEMMEKAQITAALVERVPRWAVLGEVDYRMPLTMRIDELSLKGTRTDPKVSAPPPMVKTLSGTVVKSTPKSGKKDGAEEKPRITAPAFTHTLTIAGTAEENNDVADYIASLKQSPVLRNVELTFIRDQKFDDMVLRQFEIVALLRSDVDQKALSASLKSLVDQRTAAIEATKTTEQAQAPDAGPFSNAEQGQDDTKGGN